MWYHAEEANRNAFGFDISLIRDIQFTEYNADVNVNMIGTSIPFGETQNLSIEK